MHLLLVLYIKKLCILPHGALCVCYDVMMRCVLIRKADPAAVTLNVSANFLCC
jgi:hypothetical protein